MPKFSRHSSRCHVPTSGVLRPFAAFPHRSRGAVSRAELDPTRSAPDSREFPSTAPQLPLDESRFPHPPSLPATGHSAIASDNSRYLYQPRQASLVYFGGFVFSRILRHHRVLSHERRRFRATPWNIFKIWHRSAQGHQSTRSFSCGRVIIPHSVAHRDFQIRHGSAQRDQPFSRHPLDVMVQSHVDQLGLVRNAAVNAGIRDQIVIQCNGCSHASNDAQLDAPFQPFLPTI